MPEPKYPYVECHEHPGEVEPGYIVCLHIADGQEVEISHFERATDKEMGIISCSLCLKDNNMDDFVIHCAMGLRERGLLASA